MQGHREGLFHNYYYMWPRHDPGQTTKTFQCMQTHMCFGYISAGILAEDCGCYALDAVTYQARCKNPSYPQDDLNQN
jgi:hypothetical protein